MATNRDGVVGFNESNNTFKNDDKHGYWNLPASDVETIDNKTNYG
jgi:hypothetical protein